MQNYRIKLVCHARTVEFVAVAISLANSGSDAHIVTTLPLWLWCAVVGQTLPSGTGIQRCATRWLTCLTSLAPQRIVPPRCHRSASFYISSARALAAVCTGLVSLVISEPRGTSLERELS